MKTIPFANDKSYFSSIAFDKRGDYIMKMLATPHEEGQPHNIKVEYPYQNTFNYKGFKLNYFHTELHADPTALIFYLHGLNTHGGNSSYLGTTFSSEIANVNVYAIDFLNFGKSVGYYKGYIESFQDMINQAQAFVDHISSMYTKKPKKFLVGCSFGGAISFKMTLINPKKYDGVVFLVPALREVKQSQYIMKKIGKLIGYFLPKIKLTKQSLDSYKHAVQSQDPYQYNGRNIPGTIRVCLNAMQEIQQLYNQFDTPYIVFQAGVDKLVDPFAPLDLEKACKTKDKTTIYMKDMWHSIFRQKQIEQIVKIATQWVRQRL